MPTSDQVELEIFMSDGNGSGIQMYFQSALLTIKGS